MQRRNTVDPSRVKLLGKREPLTHMEIQRDVPLTCPHCQIQIEQRGMNYTLDSEYADFWAIERYYCRTCRKSIIFLIPGRRGFATRGNDSILWMDEQRMMVYPRVGRPISEEIPESYRQDYIEASLIIQDSPRASAALARRCLQNIIRNELNITKKNLHQEINECIKQGRLPPRLKEDLHTLREVGNIAAHPLTSDITGEIVNVDHQEAEYTLAILEDVFEHLFITPARHQKRRERIQKKIQETKPQKVNKKSKLI